MFSRSSGLEPTLLGRMPTGPPTGRHPAGRRRAGSPFGAARPPPASGAPRPGTVGRRTGPDPSA